MKVAKIRGFYKSCYAGWPTKIYLVMRLTALFLFAACLEVQAHGYSQGKLTLSEKDSPLPKIFQAIERQSDYHFFYDYSLLQAAGKVDVNVKNASLDDVLNICFKGQAFTYSVVGKMVTVVENKAMEAPVEIPPTIIPEFKGRVTNESGEPLQGATVELQKGKVGTFTDEKGMFTLKNVEADAVLEISFTGYQKTTVKLAEVNSLGVVLKVATNQLDQVQIIAYGTTTQRLNTGDVSSVTSEEIEEQPVSNPLTALEGRIPGMFITQNSGVPGSSISVQIRGQNSIANGNDPLYIIDGVPYASELLPGVGTSIIGTGNPLSFINPYDIESIDVLKDADATAIYGSRGANGVVLITTKKGKAGVTRGSLNVYQGMGKVTRTESFLNTSQYLEMRDEAFKNDGASASATDYDINGTWDTTRFTDWKKDLIGGTAHYTDVQGSVSGGNSNTQYLMGGGFHRETTVFPGDFADQKGSVHFNLSNISSDHRFKAVLSGNYLIDNNNLLNIDYTSQLQYLPPDAPPGYNPDGSINWANATWPSANPYTYLLWKFHSATYNLISNAVLSYQVLPGLEIKTSLGYNNLSANGLTTNPLSSIDPLYISYGAQSSSIFSNSFIHSWIIEPQVSYQTLLGKGELTALIGSTIQQNNDQGTVQTGTGFTNDALLENIQAASSISVQSNTSTEYKYNSIFGRLNYDLAEKYIVNVTMRRDGSSRFAPGRQFGDFGAIGVGWNFYKETFIHDIFPGLSFGKIRMSYGTTGNDQIPDYGYLSLYNSTTHSYQSTQGLYPTNLFNQDFAWEINKKFESGLDLGFLKDRILINTSYYLNHSSNELVGYALPAITGFTSITANLPALVSNTGLEIVVNSINIKSKNFRWATSFNFSLPINKLVSFPNFAQSSYAQTYVIGRPLTVHKVYHLVGVNDTTGAYQFADSKGSPTYSPDYSTDRTSIINTAPKYYGGLQNSFVYKGFELNVLFQFVNQIGDNNLYNFLPGSEGENQPTTVLNRWQKPGDKKPIQRFNQNYSIYGEYSDAVASDQGFSSASFVRLKNLSVSYTIPSKSIKKTGMQSCRVYIQGQNLLTFTKYIGNDPENQNSGSLPPLRVLTAGIQLTL